MCDDRGDIMPLLATSGARIRYERIGQGPAVLLIQGVGVVGGGWRPQVDALARRFEVFTFDNRGIGGSTRDEEALTVEAMAADGLGIMDAAGIDRFHLIGHSMGGVIAQAIALRAPERVRSLSLLCTFANGRDATALSLPMLVHGLRSRVGTRTMRRNGMLRMIMPAEYLRQADRRALHDELQQLFGRDLADQPPIVMTQLRALSAYDTTPRLRELGTIPTLVVSGAHDPISPPRLGRALAAAIAGARFVEFAQASHALPIQCADEVNTLLMDHLAAADARR